MSTAALQSPGAVHDIPSTAPAPAAGVVPGTSRAVCQLPFTSLATNAPWSFADTW